MRSNRVIVVGSLCIVGVLLLAGGVFAGSEEDVAAINKVREMEAMSLNSADTSHAAHIYSADVEYVPPGEPALKGAEAVGAWLGAMLEQFEGNLVYTASDIKVAGDWAFEQYAANVTLTPKAGGDAIVETARGIHIYHRGEDGSWKITHDVWNYDAPAAE